jgi:hypothetical protein
MSYLHVKWNRIPSFVISQTVSILKHDLPIMGHCRSGGMRRRRRSG